ncbi:ribosome production factor 2 homolog [Styela clava]
MEEGIVKPKSQRHRRVLEQRAPKIFENDKTALFIRGGNTSNIITTALQELHMMKKPGSILFKKRNISRPFEDASSIEFLTKMNDASLFLFGSHSKKRPNNLVIGRTYDRQVLDMFELGIENFKSFKDFLGEKCGIGAKPCLIFNSENFETDSELRRLKSLFIDFFRGPVVSNVTLKGLEHVMSFTVVDEKILLRNYKVNLKKSGTRTPRIELQEMGPNFDFILRRTKLASDDLYKRACRKPKAAKVSKVKNISRGNLGEKRGRIHMTKQDMGSLQLRKVKALKRKLPTANDGDKKTKTSD